MPLQVGAPKLPPTDRAFGQCGMDWSDDLAGLERRFIVDDFDDE